MSEVFDFSAVEPVFRHAGWTFERLKLGKSRWLSATKRFESAGGARDAVIYLRRTSEGGLYMYGHYESAGENVLASWGRLIRPEDLDRADSILTEGLHDALGRIEASWGRRILRMLEKTAA